MVSVGERLREIRQSKGLSQAALGKMVGLSDAAITQYEKGRRQIGADELPRIAEALGVSPCDFYEQREPTAPERVYQAVMRALREGEQSARQAERELHPEPTRKEVPLPKRPHRSTFERVMRELTRQYDEDPEARRGIELLARVIRTVQTETEAEPTEGPANHQG